MFFRPSRALCAILTVSALVFPGWAPIAYAQTVPAAAVLIPDDTFWQKEWYMRQINAPGAWAVTTGSPNVIVATIDAGVDINHADLQKNIWTNTKEIPGDGIDNDHDGYIDDVHGWNFVSRTGDVRPERKDRQLEETWSHGTMVASLIAGRGNDGIGVAGVAWNVRVMPLVVLDADGQGEYEAIMAAMRYAVSHGASVINLSLVGFDENDELTELIRNASNAGVVIVAATGNDENKDGMNLDQIPAFPVCGDGSRNYVLGVSGTDTLDQKAPYANFGKRCTDVSAPAQEFFVARPSYPHDTKATSSVPGYIGGMTGTSLAAPLVSGVAALIKSVRPSWTSAQIRERIVMTSDAIEDNLTLGQKGGLGHGRLNAARALEGLGLAPVVAVKPLSKTAVKKLRGTAKKNVLPVKKTFMVN